MPSRRTVLSAAAAGGATALAGCLGSADRDRSQDWPQFGYDATNGAHNPDGRGPADEPNPLWVRRAGAHYRNSTQPHVAGAVYAPPFYGGPTAGANAVYAVDSEGGLRAWTHDGAARWSDSLDPPVSGSPVPSAGRVFVGTGDGLLYGLGSA